MRPRASILLALCVAVLALLPIPWQAVDYAIDGVRELPAAEADRVLVGSLFFPNMACGVLTGPCITAPGVINECTTALTYFDCRYSLRCYNCTLAAPVTRCKTFPETTCEQGGATTPTPCGLENGVGCGWTWIVWPVTGFCFCPAVPPFPPTTLPCRDNDCVTHF